VNNFYNNLRTAGNQFWRKLRRGAQAVASIPCSCRLFASIVYKLFACQPISSAIQSYWVCFVHGISKVRRFKDRGLYSPDASFRKPH
jgi:hypothetical protein